jgi:tape measure domain-containing protein
VFGQVNATGKLMGQDTLQLINNNIPITTMLAKDLGISVKEVKERMEDGAISADDFNNALANATKEGGFAFGGMDALAQTLGGRLSTLRDKVTEFGLALIGVTISEELGFVVQPGGVFDRLSILVPQITAKLTEFIPKIQEGFGWLIDNKETILAVIASIAGAFTVAAIAGGILAVVALDPIILAAGAITLVFGLLAAALMPVIENMGGVGGVFETVKTKVQELWTTFTTQFAPAIAFVKQQLLDTWDVIQTDLVPALRGLWDAVAPMLIPALKFLASVLVGGLFVGFTIATEAFQDFVRIISPAVAILSVMVEGIKEALKYVGFLAGKLANFSLGKLGELGGKMSSFASGLKSSIPGFANGVTNFSGGLAMVGEQGPELVSMPRGSNVISNNDLKSIGGGSGQQSSNVTVNLHGNFMGDKTAIRQLTEAISNEMSRMATARGTA